MKICKGCSYYNIENSKCELKGFTKEENETCENFIGVIYNDAKIYTQVWQIFVEGMTGWCSDNVEDFKEELESLNEDYCRDEPEKQFNVDFVMDCLRLLPVSEEVSFKNVTFRKFLMDYEEYKNMPEFAGW